MFTRAERDALDALKRTGGVRFEVPRVVARAHDMQRSAEPPAPWSLALAARRAAEGLPPVAARRTSSEVPKPYTLALQRRAAEAR